jgi:hypothetical protein
MTKIAELPAPAYVYVIGAADGPQKIGVASDVEARRAMLQTGNPAGLVVVHHWALPRPAAFAVEGRAHWHLRDRHVRGEWFDVTPDEAIAAVEAARCDWLAGAPDAPEAARRASYWQQRLKAAGLTQVQLARLAGRREVAISEGLSGKGKFGVPTYLINIIRLWEITPPEKRAAVLANPDVDADVP